MLLVGFSSVCERKDIVPATRRVVNCQGKPIPASYICRSVALAGLGWPCLFQAAHPSVNVEEFESGPGKQQDYRTHELN
jgi:hypothetical protein